MPIRKSNLIHNNEQEALQWLLRYSPQVVLHAPYRSLAEQNSSIFTMASTRTRLYTMAELEKLRLDDRLTDAQWRQVGDNQKVLYRERLLKRVGHAAPTSMMVPAFQFHNADWQNIFQLEALVEFYLNFNDPWQSGPYRVPGVNVPGTPSNLLNLYQTVDLLRGWHLVVIDSFGGRLSGSTATAVANIITLDGLPNPSKVNHNFDTIYLPNDTARPSKTYRITSVDDTNHTVTLDGQPALHGGSSHWHIPAGVSGQLPSLNYNLGPGGRSGFDHFDGALFIVKDGKVSGNHVETHNQSRHIPFRWNSYTSRSHPLGSQELSSMRGNKRYDFSSFRSGLKGSFRNYNFKVNDAGEAYDGVSDARFYFSTPVTGDIAPAGVNPQTDPQRRGKSLIRIHYSETISAGGCNSAGCLVSGHDFYEFRDRMIELFQGDYGAAHNGRRDAAMDRLLGQGHASSREIWCRTQAALGEPQDSRCPGNLAAGPTVTPAEWNKRIRGTLWLVRPDERPLG